MFSSQLLSLSLIVIVLLLFDAFLGNIHNIYQNLGGRDLGTDKHTNLPPIRYYILKESPYMGTINNMSTKNIHLIVN